MPEDSRPFAAIREDAILVKAQLRLNRESLYCGSGLIQKSTRNGCRLPAGVFLVGRLATQISGLRRTRSRHPQDGFTQKSPRHKSTYRC